VIRASSSIQNKGPIKNCTRVAASRLQIVPAWPPVSCNMNKIDGNLHATGGHAGTICMRLVATRVQFASDWRPLGYQTIETSTQEVCKRPSLHPYYIFLALASPHPRCMLLTIQLTTIGYLVWKMC
jgi:hypothetical protein